MKHIVAHVPVSPFQMNAWICGNPDTREAVLIDAGADPSKLNGLIAMNDLKLVAILQTHAHWDHAGALRVMQEQHGVPVTVHKQELPIYNALEEQGSRFGLPPVPNPLPPDHLVEDGESFEVAGMTVKAHFLPGHTPGSVAFEIGDHLFVGDVLFSGSIGRTDLPGGSPSVMTGSLRKLFELRDDLKVHSGHGPDTTIGRERASNPFVKHVLSGGSLG